ncbi:hypothetical protein HELRODRAFT_187234 [Helobdella robusta]|uniref:SH3 domain-containing protein n=1 Tax=Helobdella robusta TaxID=6412 RepID=T1FP81_HELRO|nr:hypothetical protein HELRODRAFT_187234 [Helobdella robusta]ESN99911.1 hypothetical protein HELRODRAFT_187234 [Helobdella robusta]
MKIGDPNVCNDEGMTPLHHAIFGEHFHIVEYMVGTGCDVNFPDIDGWTPLHCAASCNDLKMCEFLVENGACVHSTTSDDQQLPSEKCDEVERGYEETKNYLLKIEAEVGLANNGLVYALYDYTDPESSDELTYISGDCLVVLRRGDDVETEWWWCCLESREGYVARNLVGMYPRVTPLALQ